MNAFAIHAHFYQPPREDPLTGFIPIEPSAAPFSNWNERIHTECYRPNAELRNFEQISFNIGPTLFNWMKRYDPETCLKIVEQDRINMLNYGCGNAIAQAYNHTILPLGTLQDKITQIYWGIVDFKHHFGRAPRGLWLPETAIDYETLDVLAQFDIEFTILAPWQASTPEVDPTEPYYVSLPNKRSITVFFYEKELSSKVSFDSLATINADHFARQILAQYFNPEKTRRGTPQILLIASDGELYGHHKSMREMFLARLVDGASKDMNFQPVFPALWLDRHKVLAKIEIKENTSWSCHHGVSRWMGSCDCATNDSKWKLQLRAALDRLAKELDGLFVDSLGSMFKDPWELRNQYIHVLLGQISMDALAAEKADRPLSSEELRRAQLLLECQCERQRMFTSCGWFFDDFDRIEPQYNVAYAAQAVRLGYLATGINLEAQTTSDLQHVISPRSGLRADQVFERHLRKAESAREVRIGYGD